MHIVRHIRPVHDEARAMRAEYGRGRFIEVRLGLVTHPFQHLLGVMARQISGRLAGQLAEAARVQHDLLAVLPHGGNGTSAAQGRVLRRMLAGLEFRTHALEVRHGTAQLVGRDLQRKTIDRLQKNTLRRHQALAHGAIGRLAEIAALRVLRVRLPRDQRQPCIGKLRAGQHAAVALFGQMRQDETLPVHLQFVHRNAALEHEAAPRRQRLHQQMHLRIMSQRLVVAAPDHRLADGLFIYDRARVERHVDAETVRDHGLQYLHLDIAHDLHLDAAAALVPVQAQHRVLFLQQADAPPEHVRIDAVRQDEAIGQHRA